MKNGTWAWIFGLLLIVAGCGGQENKVVIPEDPVPLPPGGAQTIQVGPATADGAPGSSVEFGKK